jgi:hypothetical protein
LERESFVKAVELMIQEISLLSMQKWICENYLFEDYYWKSGIRS